MTDLLTRLLLLISIGALVWLGTRGKKSNPESNGVIWLFIIVGLGTALRFYALTFDFPDSYHHDERWKVRAVLSMIESNSLNPGYFFHPSLLLYATLFVTKILSLAGFIVSSDTVRLAGRIVSALAGSGTIVLLYAIASFVWEKRGGLLAAFVLTVNPVHITCSRYLKEDSLLVFWMFGALLMALHFYKSPTFKKALLLGLSVGFAIGTKYTGLLATPLLLLSFAIPNPFSHRMKFLFSATGTMIIAFIISTPYALIDAPLFLQGVAYEQRHIVVGNTIPISAWSQLGLYHFTRGVIPSFMVLGAALALIGIGSWIKLKKDHWWIILAIFCLWYFPAELVKSKIEPQPERYILPAIPLICLFVSVGLRSIESIWNKKMLVMPLLMMLSAPTALSSMELIPDTRVAMGRFIERNVPYGSSILLDHYFNTPQLDKSKWDVHYIHIRPLTRGYPEELNPQSLRKRKISYVLLSSHTYQCLLFCKETPDVVRRSVLRAFKKLSPFYEVRPRFTSFGFHNPVLTLFKVTESDETAPLDASLLPPNPFWPIPAPFSTSEQE